MLRFKKHPLKKWLFMIVFISILTSPLFAGDAKENFFNAVLHRRTNEFTNMLSSGMDINISGNGGITALIISVQARYNPQIRFFVENGANIDQPDEEGNTPLYYAVGNNNREIVLYLLQNKANPNLRNNKNRTPLSYAINKGYHEIALLLLQKKSSLFRIDIDHIISRKYYLAHTEMIDSIKIMDTKIYGYPILKAVSENDYKEVRSLLDQGYSVDTTDSTGVTLLMLSASLKNSYIGELLIKRGASINQVDHSRRSALGYAAYFGNKGLLDYLISKKAFIDNAEFLEESPLFLAFLAGEKHIFLKLLVQSKNRDITDKEGFSLLSYAAYLADTYTLTRIIKVGGVEVDKNNIHNKTPLALAMEGYLLRQDNSDYYTIARKLLKAGAKPYDGMVFPDDPEMRNILYKRDD